MPKPKTKFENAVNNLQAHLQRLRETGARFRVGRIDIDKQRDVEVLQCIKGDENYVIVFPPVNHPSAPVHLSNEDSKEVEAVIKSPPRDPAGNQYTGAVCANCGSARMIMMGACRTCLDCGSTTGCG